MAVLIAEFTNSQTNTVLIEGVAGKRIQVLRAILSPTTTGQMRLQAARAGGTHEPLFGWLRGSSGRTTELTLGKEYAVATGAGEGLSMTTELGSYTEPHCVTIWYELVA